MTAVAASAFDRATAARPTGDGAFTVTFDPAWDAPAGPNGGYVAALVLRAMQGALRDPARTPRSLTLHYLRAGGPGDATVHVAEERCGRTLTTLSARLVQGERVLALALAAFATDADRALDHTTAPPAVPAPEEVPEVRLPTRLFPIAAFFEYRPALGAAPFTGAGELSETGGWLRLREDRPLDALLLAVSADAWWPVPFARLEGFRALPTIDLTLHFRAVPPARPGTAVLARFSSRATHGGFFEEDGELWAPDGTLLVQSRQLALGR